MKRILGVVAAVLLAAVGTLFLVLYVKGAEERALAGEETVEVLVVAEPIEKGAPADAIAEAVIAERVPAKVRATGSVADLSDLQGRVASVDLMPGEQLVASRFLTPTQLEEEREVEMPEGLQEVTVSLEPQRAVGGQLSPGDTVGVLSSFEMQDDRTEEQVAAAETEQYQQYLSDTTKKILHKVLVTKVQVEQLPQQSGEGDEPGASGPELAPTGNLLVTLAVDVPQVERIVFTAEHGMLWLTNEPEAANEDGSLLRTPENIYND